MVDEAGAEALEEEETYRNAGNPSTPRPVQRGPVHDERMPDEWIRAQNQEGEVVGFIGQRPIIRPTKEIESEAVVANEVGSDSGSGVMAALARLRQQERE